MGAFLSSKDMTLQASKALWISAQRGCATDVGKLVRRYRYDCFVVDCALQVAARNGHAATVQSLLAAKACARNDTVHELAKAASHVHSPEVCAMLVLHGAAGARARAHAVDWACEIDTLLHFATRASNVVMVGSLLEAKANPNRPYHELLQFYRSVYRTPALFQARCPRIALMLIRHKADVNCYLRSDEFLPQRLLGRQSWGGPTPLHSAVQRIGNRWQQLSGTTDARVVLVLLHAKARADVTDNIGRTALDYCARCNARIASLMLNASTNVGSSVGTNATTDVVTNATTDVVTNAAKASADAALVTC